MKTTMHKESCAGHRILPAPDMSIRNHAARSASLRVGAHYRTIASNFSPTMLLHAEERVTREVCVAPPPLSFASFAGGWRSLPRTCKHGAMVHYDDDGTQCWFRAWSSGQHPHSPAYTRFHRQTKNCIDAREGYINSGPGHWYTPPTKYAGGAYVTRLPRS
ncbi:protein of unknown function [Methanoculleus bourgensis]|uniref:Uncharacterized protein n=1 Tax=Methanoculleus bourgensis TaxID=83986 RepID=A0A0X3BRV7_9EURY|nr:protein of unknown function [Methanoculleus bourgensis]